MENLVPVLIQDQQPEIIIAHPAGIEQSLALIGSESAEPEL